MDSLAGNWLQVRSSARALADSVILDRLDEILKLVDLVREKF